MFSIDLNTLLTGQDPGCVWTAHPGNPAVYPLTGSVVEFPTCTYVPGVYQYIYTCTNPCGMDSEIVTINLFKNMTINNVGNEIQCTLCGVVQPTSIYVCITETCDNSAVDIGCDLTIKTVPGNTTVYTTTFPAGSLCNVISLPVLPPGNYSVSAICGSCSPLYDEFAITNAPNVCAGTDEFWALIPNGSISAPIDLNDYLGTGVVLGSTTCWYFISGPDGMLQEPGCNQVGNNIFDFISYPPANGNYVFTFETCQADGQCCDTASITLEIV